jgi:manganese efflux pump family protein
VFETSFFSILIIALGLSADCFAVALSASITKKSLPFLQGFRVALSFGIFQAAMTIIGWLAGRTVIDLISSYDHWLAFGLLLFVGGRMIWESFHENDNKARTDITQWHFLLLLSIATSLDALAVGLSFAFLEVNLILASVTIGVVALIITFFGFFAGKKLGALAGKRAEIIGGVILIAIGVRILLEHLL